MIARLLLVLAVTASVATASTAGAQVSAAHTPAAAANPRSMIRLAREGQPAPRATLADIDWMRGHWAGQMPDGPVEQISLEPKHGHLPFFVRAVTDRLVMFYEIATMAEVNGTLAVRVKHFTPELHGWEPRDGYIERRLVAREGDTWYFDGITYVRTGPESHVVYFLNRAPDGAERDTIVVPFRRK